MAYNRTFVWPSPDTGKMMPLDKYGLTYTFVECDVPQMDFSRELWEVSPILTGFEENEFITFYTSTFYKKGSLKVFCNGELVPVIEDTRREKNLFKVKSTDANGKDMYCQYVPSKFTEFLGDQRERVRSLYSVTCTKKHSPFLRETIHLARNYINRACEALDIERPLWVGGIANQEIGVADNLFPKFTPIDLELHLRPIENALRMLSKYVIAKGYNNIGSLSKASFSINFLEDVQRVLIEIDKGLKAVL